MEGLALTGAWTDPDKGLLSLIVLEMGSSSRLCAALKPGEPVVVMGPTGTPTEIPEGETVVLAGGGLGNAVLFSIGKALRAAGCKVIYFAAYRKAEDIFKVDEIEAASDVIVWSTDVGAGAARRAGRRIARSSATSCRRWRRYANGELGAQAVPLGDGQRIIAIGSDRMMRAVKEARHGAARGASCGPSTTRIGEHQLADAVHDEGSVRAVPAEVDRPAHGQGDGRLQLLQPGSADGPRRLRQPGGAPARSTRCRRS